jgi:hypothetical protein
MGNTGPEQLPEQAILEKAQKGTSRSMYQFISRLPSLAICSWLCASEHGSSSNGESAWHKYPEESMTNHHPPLKTGERKEGRHFDAIGSATLTGCGFPVTKELLEDQHQSIWR